MSQEVEIIASAALSSADISEIESEVRGWGLDPYTRRMPPRRGAELSWLLMMAIPAEILAKAVLEKVGADAYEGLRGLVQRVLRRHGRDASAAPGGVVIESASSGAQFALEADLPIEAYRQLFDDIANGSPADGLRMFDREHQRWRAATA
jgi:hypothetical protein